MGDKCMKIKIDNVEVNYIQYGEGSDVLLLHGWGQNIQMMRPLGDNLCSNHRITIIDFPGFGESSEPPVAWSVRNYAVLVEKLVEKLNIKKPTVIGHSFGGRVAIYFSADNPIDKLVLFGSPCMKEKEELTLSVRILKKIKKLPGMDKFGDFMKQYIGSPDYRAASPIMRQTLVNVVNEDLASFARRIEEPTLLIWGEHDEAVPVEEARELEKIMIDAALIVLPGTHYAYLENLGQVINILNNFI
jgi:pimeloyl-ACP methyl ester carboxylesterase